MNQRDYDAAIAGMSQTKREIIRCGQERGGLFCVPDVYRNRGDKPVPGRYVVAGDGMKNEMADLMRRGFLRDIGKQRTKWGSRATHYRVVEPGLVERVRDDYEPPTKKTRRSAAAKLRDIPKPKPEMGDYEAWLRTRRSMLQLTSILETQLPRQVLWECIPEDDIVIATEDIADLYVALGKAVKLITMRAESEELRATIEKTLAGTEDGDLRGRTEHEAAAARKAAERLRRKYEALYG